MLARRSKVQQAYGYAVCLVCIVAGLITLLGVMNAAFELADPTRNSFAPAASFEEFKFNRTPHFAPAGQVVEPLPPDSILRRVYESERAESIARGHWQALRTFTTNAVVLLVAILLFTAHWRWLRGADDDSLPDARLTA